MAAKTHEVLVGRLYVDLRTSHLYTVIETGRLTHGHDPVVIHKAKDANEYTTSWVTPYKEFVENFKLA